MHLFLSKIAILDQSDIQSHLFLLFNPDTKKHPSIYIYKTHNSLSLTHSSIVAH